LYAVKFLSIVTDNYMRHGHNSILHFSSIISDVLTT
jgi:hypothetical protein